MSLHVSERSENKVSSALFQDNNTISGNSSSSISNTSSSRSLKQNDQTPKPQTITKPRSFKIIVLGESGVGKTCLSFRFCAGRFPMNTEATIGLDFREKVNYIYKQLGEAGLCQTQFSSCFMDFKVFKIIINGLGGR